VFEEDTTLTEATVNVINDLDSKTDCLEAFETLKWEEGDLQTSETATSII
jgi:hypothetical protein